jgi:dTDP-4-dehydrorhamnose reductase
MELQELAGKYKDVIFYFNSRGDLDITNARSIEDVFNQIHPDYCINCAAYTAVDNAEGNSEEAFLINATAVKLLAYTCAGYNTNFIHISTDYVFDGNATTPYKELDETNPISVYGASKRQGEIEALKFSNNSIILRPSWMYSSFGNNFVKTMLRLFQMRSEVNVVTDQFGSPTYAADLAEVISTIIKADKPPTGIYHYSNAGIISWYEFATAIKEITGSNCIINPITTDQYRTAAKRPKYSGLNKEKIQTILGINLKNWKESLQKCIAKINSSTKLETENNK